MTQNALALLIEYTIMCVSYIYTITTPRKGINSLTSVLGVEISMSSPKTEWTYFFNYLSSVITKKLQKQF